MAVPAIIEDQEDKLANIKVYFKGRFRECLDGVPNDLMIMPVEELEAIIDPTQIDWLLRHRFWNLIETAEHFHQENISTAKVYAGITVQGQFYQKWILDPRRIAWLLHPIERDKIHNQEIYYQLSKKLRKYLIDTPVTQDNIESMIKVLKMAADRAFGPPVQKIQSHNVNVEIPAPGLNEERPVSPEDIRAKIKELEATITKQQEVVIDVEEKDN